jgi:hypothetical protein
MSSGSWSERGGVRSAENTQAGPCITAQRQLEQLQLATFWASLGSFSLGVVRVVRGRLVAVGPEEGVRGLDLAVLGFALRGP